MTVHEIIKSARVWVVVLGLGLVLGGFFIGSPTAVDWLICGVLAVVTAGALLSVTSRRSSKTSNQSNRTLLFLFNIIIVAALPVIGYVAAVRQFDLACVLLFITTVAVQLPLRYTAAMTRQNIYISLPTPPNDESLSRVVWQMRAAGIVVPVGCYYLSNNGYAGFMFGLGIAIAAIYCLAAIFSPDWRRYTDRVAQTVFKRSLLLLGAFCFFMILSNVLL